MSVRILGSAQSANIFCGKPFIWIRCTLAEMMQRINEQRDSSKVRQFIATHFSI